MVNVLGVGIMGFVFLRLIAGVLGDRFYIFGLHILTLVALQ